MDHDVPVVQARRIYALSPIGVLDGAALGGRRGLCRAIPDRTAPIQPAPPTPPLPSPLAERCRDNRLVAKGRTGVVRAENMFDALVMTRNQAGSIYLDTPRTLGIGIRFGG